jgi:predicted nucleic acid-binding protein
MIHVFFDACVIVPITLTNVLLTAAEEGLVRPSWSPEVVGEAVEALLELFPDMTEARARRRFSRMDEFFAGASVEPDMSVVAGLNWPDPDDRHVVAAAVAAEAPYLITNDRTGFPEELMGQFNITVLTQDELLLRLINDDEDAMIDVVRLVAQRLDRPPLTVEEILAALERADAPRFAEAMRTILAEPPGTD